MKNSKIKITDKWIINRDEFYDINPWDKSVSEDVKFNEVYVQEDMLWIKLDNFNLDLGWYGGETEGFFGLYLFRGKDWHECQLLEKRTIRDYDELIETINAFTKNVEMGEYDPIEYKPDPIEDYWNHETKITLNQ